MISKPTMVVMMGLDGSRDTSGVIRHEPVPLITSASKVVFCNCRTYVVLEGGV